MKFQPKTDKEISEANLWQAGNYGFEIIEATDKVSKSGNEMIELKLKVYNDEGGYIFVNDYLLESLAYKLKHAAGACGLSEQYEDGVLVSHDFIGKMGHLKLKIQKSKDPAYADKNAVGDYVVQKDGDVPVALPPSNPITDDSIPWN